MAYQPSEGSNSAFASGVQHQVNPARGNAGSITMGDQGLDHTSQDQAQLTPHSVLSTTPGAASSGVNFAGMQRLNNSYQAGSMGKFQDELDGGADTYESGEE
jgi:hypothetical protein